MSRLVLALSPPSVYLNSQLLSPFSLSALSHPPPSIVDVVLGAKLKDRSAPYTGISLDDVVELVIEKDPLKTTPTPKAIKKVRQNPFASRIYW